MTLDLARTDATAEEDALDADDETLEAKDAVDVAADRFRLEDGLEGFDVTVGMRVRGNRSEGSPAGT